jgi:hypothetical protein
MPEAYKASVKILKLNYFSLILLLNIMIFFKKFGDWLKGYNEKHPHSELKVHLKSEFRAAEFVTA